MTGTQIQSKERSESLTRSKQMAISAVNNLMLRGLAPQLAFACVTWGPLIPHSDGNYYSYRTVVFEWKSPSSFVYTKITLILKLESGSPDSSWGNTEAITIETFDVESGRARGKMIIEGNIASNIQYNDLQKSILL